jgi:DNA polymerase III delta prime subunit
MNTKMLLNEKYRPIKLEDFVGSEDLKNNILAKFIENDNLQNIILYGRPGVGKTTLALLLVKNIDCEYIKINASDENGIDTIRGKVKNFATSRSFKPLKVIILDEADLISSNGQGALRNIIETFSNNVRFILTCNFIEKIIDPLQSRCHCIEITQVSKKDVAKRLIDIMNLENIKFEMSQIKQLIESYYPDMRKLINVIQMGSQDGGILKIDKNFNISESYLENILEELGKPKPKLQLIRQCIVNSRMNSFDSLFRYIYENLDVIYNNESNIGMAIYLINQYKYKSISAIDQEINVVALMYELINLKTQ